MRNYRLGIGVDKPLETKRAQCTNCLSITVFDTTTYEGKRLEWAKCSECEDYIQLDLEDLREYEIGQGTTFLAQCKNGHTDYYYYEKNGLEIKKAPERL